MSTDRSNRVETRSKTSRSTGKINYEEARRQLVEVEAQLKARERSVREREQELREREEAYRASVDGMKPEEIDPMSYMMKEMMNMRSENQHGTSSRQIDKALAIIPSYIGKNMPLSSFIRACKRARQMIPTYPEDLFTQAAVRKPYDSAYVAIDRHNPRTMLALCSRLRQTLGTYHSLDYHRTELKNVFMSENEQVIDYIGRVPSET